jgi:hypothetical protein
MEAYFSDIRSKIVERIDKAESSIKIAMAWFTNQVLFQLLLDKAAGGTKIELIISSSETNFIPGSSLQFEALQRKGANVKVLISYEGYQFMHHKFAVIDDKEVITGSYNWSNNAHTNYENILIIADIPVARTFTLQFERLMQNENIRSLNDFKYHNNLNSVQTDIQTDAALFSLSREFGEEVTSSMQEARNLNLGIRMDIIEGMIKRYTAVGAARKLSNDDEQSGFIKLVTVNRADLTIEYLTAKSHFEKLFDKVTIKNAKAKLYPYIGDKVNII